MPFRRETPALPSASSAGPFTSREAAAFVLDANGDLGQRGRVLPVVMRAEQEFLEAVEEDPNVRLSATAIAAVHGIHRPGEG